MSTTRVLLDWVKEQVPALKSRVVETQAAVERSRARDDDLQDVDIAQDSKETCRAA